MTSEELALAMRKDTVQMIHNSHAAHIGAVLSVIVKIRKWRQETVLCLVKDMQV